ncbi:hypothetical protein F2Q68_00034485 [Brassica cretica]|uniref:Retrotransposon gag domain-containing protein n=1 Tax=Brassica cretica TaxID=69181 RepID=A0A8S9H4T4_BRACR|nr:hypothetical protein F2Q68_00034485 [Brassica cretica]
MEDVLSRAWEHVKLEEDVASRARLKPNRIRSPLDQTGETEMKDPPKRDPRTPEAGTGAELVNKLRQMVQQVKWPPNMKAPDSFRNPGLWCDFHRDHGHKTEDCVTLKIEVNELRQKGHLQEFLSEKAKAHLSKESLGKSKGDAPSSPPRQNRVIHVISGGSEVSGVSHAAAKKSTRNAKHGLETTQPKRLLLNTDEISFTAKEQEKILAPHHDALVVSLTIANCLVKRILVDNGSSSNIIFLTVYQDLGLEENTLTRKVTPLIGFSGETGVFLTPSLGISVSYNLSRGAALETWRGTDPEFPREFVGGGRSLLFRGAIGFHLHVRWVAGDPGPISGTWDPGPGIWYLGSGTWKPEPGTQRMQRSIVPGAWTGILSRNNSNGS